MDKTVSKLISLIVDLQTEIEMDLENIKNANPKIEKVLAKISWQQQRLAELLRHSDARQARLSDRENM